MAITEPTITYSNIFPSLESAVHDERLTNSTYSIAVRHAATGELLYGKYADQGITPASSLKILTAAAALETLGENHCFSTAVLMDGFISEHTLHGNLYLRGQGDPTLRMADFNKLAVALAKKGIKKITGDLVGDDTWFDDIRLSPGIAQEDESYYYAASVSALNFSPNADFDTGAIKVDAKPSRIGCPAKVLMAPGTEFMEIDNRSQTVSKNAVNTLLIEREPGTNKIIITGNAPLGSAGAKEWITVPDPTSSALFNFKLALAKQDIRFSAAAKTAAGKVPIDGRLLVSKKSMPLKKLLIPFMKLSNNSHAEVLAKEMGKRIYGEGSWESGIRVMRDVLTKLGLDAEKWQFEDASGMSHANKISAAELTKLLYLVRSRPWFSHFLKGLPVGGAPERFIGGTLRKRFTTKMAKGNVIAKTGTLTEVSSLSGYVKTKSGDWLVFVVLTQDFDVPAIPAIDRFVESIIQAHLPNN